VSSCDCSNEPLGSIKCGEFLNYLKTCQIPKKDPAPWRKLVIVGVNHILWCCSGTVKWGAEFVNKRSLTSR
jgi:hypothetical protein